MTDSLVFVPVIAALLSIAAPGQATAAKFDCDTAAKRLSEIDLPVAGPHLRIFGVISSQMVRDDDRWAPKMSVYVSDAGQQFGGFSMVKMPGQPWALTLRYSGRESAPVAALNKFDPTPFALDVNASSGTVLLKLGQNEYRGAGRPFVADHLTLSCSTGNFMFDQLSWDIIP